MEAMFMLNPVTGEALQGAPRLQVHTVRHLPPHEQKARMPQRVRTHHRSSRLCPNTKAFRISSSLIEQYTCKFTLTDSCTLPEENKSCTVCLDSFEEGQQLRTLPCLHFFHPQCVDKWLKGNAKCPTCRACLSDLSQKATDLTGSS